MIEQNEKDKAEVKDAKKRRKPLEYRKFEKLLKQVIKAPPMKPSQGKTG